MGILDDMVARVVAMCKEATPEARDVQDYLLGSYANYPHWRVGDRNMTVSPDMTEYLALEAEMVARLYVGKINAAYKGDTERAARPLIETAVRFFGDHLRLTSEAYPQPMNYMQPRGIVFGTPRRIIDDTSEEGKVLYIEFTWTVPLRVPRKVRS